MLHSFQSVIFIVWQLNVTDSVKLKYQKSIKAIKAKIKFKKYHSKTKCNQKLNFSKTIIKGIQNRQNNEIK